MVIGGLITLGLGKAATEDWRLLVYIIAIPAIVYLIMLARAKFPVSERVSMGATYAEMLGEFGVIGAALALFLIFRNLGETFLWPSYAVYIPIIVGSVLYGVYCKSLGRPMMIFLCLIMMPLAQPQSWEQTEPSPVLWKSR